MDWSLCLAVEVDSLRLGGTPILAGTRMPIQAILDMFLGGTPLEEIADIISFLSRSSRNSSVSLRSKLLLTQHEGPARQQSSAQRSGYEVRTASTCTSLARN